MAGELSVHPEGTSAGFIRVGNNRQENGLLFFFKVGGLERRGLAFRMLGARYDEPLVTPLPATKLRNSFDLYPFKGAVNKASEERQHGREDGA